MKKYKREEAFRFSFGEPIDALFHITKINDKEVSSSSGKAKIMDISPEGLKICSDLNIPEANNKTIVITTTFTLNESSFSVEGTIVWKKMSGNTACYGVDLMIEDDVKNNIISELKIYSKKHLKK